MPLPAVVHRAPAAQGRMLAGVAAATMLVAVVPRVALRISVNGGGCSGFQYLFDLVEDAEPDDHRIERDGELVGIFPEATISRSFEVKELKSGATRIAAADRAPCTNGP